jgi:hypothetical protein
MIPFPEKGFFDRIMVEPVKLYQPDHMCEHFNTQIMMESPWKKENRT